ncbi:hypothetical protein HIM_05237 [Hirsutella minnesotensis 3608]|uniref:Peptidase S33 tripeptidyl aminopeptidase-like C-terminal domain-containing protein n=1 Tax=Hirsutella minnesotensis 3608 TaxID=1043627 RepID=A0A0F7ZKJ7_9HYPO|nr:hypothetical protein HIM_05237 [Hirsutella minnesotensis 3608]
MIGLAALARLSSLLALANVVSAANSTIKWGPCTEKYTSSIPIDCGRHVVPLDHTEPESSPKISLDMVRVPALSKPAKGSIFLNFGGPGLEAKQTLVLLGSVLQALSGGRYNLIAFDPRGTGKTIPFTCYDGTFLTQSLLADPINLSGQDEVAQGKLWTRGTIVANICAEKHNVTGTMIGTPSVARDIVSAAEALGEDGLVRYWGFSYGTTLGATLVSMFPDKVDKVILDGVQNPHEYYNEYADFEEWTQSDQVFSGIFKACAANPGICSLARPGKSAADLERSVWELLERLRTRPVAVGTLVFDDNVLRNIVAQALYTTTSWKNLTDIIDMLMTDNVNERAILETVGGPSLVSVDDLQATVNKTMAVPMALAGIHCLDRAARPGTYEKLRPSLRRLFKTSRIMGGAGSQTSVVCAQWKLEPKERYTGDFNVRPRRPVLIIGNTYDGHTPIASAHNVSAGFKDSVVLEVNGYGHTSINLPSLCSLKTLSSYWLNGTLPKPGTVCAVDSPPFSNVTWLDVILRSTGKGKRSLQAKRWEQPVALKPWKMS